MKPKVDAYVKGLLKKYNQGIKLDIGCGASKQPGFIGLDLLDLPGVDIVHNIEKFPWPLPDESCCFAMASHLVEHISPTPHDPRLEGLINLLLKKKAVSAKEIGEYVGEFAPGPIFMRFMDEVWRVLQVGAEFAFVTPYAGSKGYWWDPTHINGCDEYTWEYFDPLGPRTGGGFYNFYKPKPWKIKINMWQANGNLEVTLIKRAFRKDGKYAN